MKKYFGLALVAFALAACSTVTIRESGTAKMSSEPTYQDSKAFWLGGLIGESHVDVAQVCKGSTPVQMQAQTTFLDGLLGGLTFAIYTPRTAKVWCK